MNQLQAEKIRILVLDDHDLFREGLARLLDAEPDFTTSHCASVEEALQILARTSVDIVLLDFDLGLQRGSEFLFRARERGFQGRVLVVTAGLTDRDAARLVRDGAAGIFLKHGPPALLSKCIRKVMEGEVWLDHRYLKALLRAGDPSEGEGDKVKFTERERAVLRGVFEGLANKEIADRLVISESSVKAALQQLFQKTGVRTRSQLVRIALEQYRDQL
ncbi:MAG: response regulator transcription factor [Acidobacteria bacterium]|nr:response regulator transcription factor [Acidobacteriota bacterium]